MKYVLLSMLAVFYTHQAIASDEVSSLRDIARESEEHRDLSIDCLIEIKISKQKGWESESCINYRKFSKIVLPTFHINVKSSTVSFKKYSKSTEASRSRVKRGLKQLLIIQSNMESFKSISKKIKKVSNT